MIDCIGTVQISFRDLMEMRALTAHCSTLLLIWTGELISSSGRRVRASSSTSGPRHAAPACTILNTPPIDPRRDRRDDTLFTVVKLTYDHEEMISVLVR
jgi:hypothetical protein